MLPSSSALPPEISQNLRFPARPYQVTAFNHWLSHADKINRAESTKLLFNMATGSGKTFLMAALMLDLYRRGFRNFLFFVNSTNILAKTRANFLNQSSSKYLFANHLMLDGERLVIREVKSFNDSHPRAINLLLTTTQKLHSSLTHPHENQLTAAELVGQKLVMIGDEAHHNTSRSLRADATSWEKTISRITEASAQTILLEFTATMDFDNAKVYQKYADHIAFRYDLGSFRRAGYSKDVQVFEAAASIEERMLDALIISQFRKKIAEKNHLKIKPLVMFKSRTIFDNQANLRTFLQRLVKLSPADFINSQQRATGILKQAWHFFEQQTIDLAELCHELQGDFAPEKLLRIDGGQKISSAQLDSINTLDEPENPCRAVFAVDMLKEGWDVLNLFDIVRLYETQVGASGQKTTISEAQLIGRGARYCPFYFAKDAPIDRRKFDHHPSSELCILEQLHYHTSHDVSYIDNLKSLLDEQGITDFAKRDQFPDPNSPIHPIQKNRLVIHDKYIINLPSASSNCQILHFGEQAEITPNVLWASLNRQAFFNFDHLQKFGYRSREDFVRQLTAVELTVIGASAPPSQPEKLQAVDKLLQKIVSEAICDI